MPVESLIVALKREKPHCGARTLRELLARRLDGSARVPARSTIHAVLNRHGLVEHRVEDSAWLVTFIEYDLGYIDLEEKTLQTIDTPFGSKVSPMSPVQGRHLSVRAGQWTPREVALRSR